VGREVSIFVAAAGEGAAVDALIQDRGSEIVEGRFRLGEVDVLTVARSVSVFQCRHDR